MFLSRYCQNLDNARLLRCVGPSGAILIGCRVWRLDNTIQTLARLALWPDGIARLALFGPEELIRTRTQQLSQDSVIDGDTILPKIHGYFAQLGVVWGDLLAEHLTKETICASI